MTPQSTHGPARPDELDRFAGGLAFRRIDSDSSSESRTRPLVGLFVLVLVAALAAAGVFLK